MSDSATYKGADPWTRALRALALLSVTPEALGGLWLRARSGPARDRFLARLPLLPLPIRKIHTSISDAQLFGEMDLSGTLDSGYAVRTAGVLDRQAALVLGGAERCPPRLAAHLGRAIDSREQVLICLDEGGDSDEIPPFGLTERLGLFVTLDGISLSECDVGSALPDRAMLEAARARAGGIAFPDSEIVEISRIAAWLGIASLRGPLLAMAAARAAAALDGADTVSRVHVAEAAALVLAHRGAPPPEQESDGPDAETDPAERPPDDAEAASGDDRSALPDDIVLDAVAAALPPGLVDRLTAPRAARTARGSGAGAQRRGNHRGRPLPARSGRPGDAARIDVISTLRAAAPWQTIRSTASNQNRSLHVRASDLRIKRYEETSDRVLIFAVDASGSLAMTRLAEAKGAVELLLSDAYSRRDHVALLAFRGEGAEVLLPPTRSLVQTKRRLQALPGGGGTPLAAGLKLALECAERSMRQGMTPTIVLLTDGRANIALDGRADRAVARDDAGNLARIIRARGIPVLAIDTGTRPQPALGEIADLLGGRYIALPRADSRRLSDAVSAALDD